VSQAIAQNIVASNNSHAARDARSKQRAKDPVLVAQLQRAIIIKSFKNN